MMGRGVVGGAGVGRESWGSALPFFVALMLVEGGGLIILLKLMRKLYAGLFLALLLVSVQPQATAPTCPYNYVENSGCKPCTAEVADGKCGKDACINFYLDQAADPVVCTAVPACQDGEFFNGLAATAAEQICTKCDSALSTQTICTSSQCPGFFWNKDIETPACQVLTECGPDTYLDSATGTCLACDGTPSAPATVCGIKNSCQKYYHDGTDCKACNDPNSDTGYLPVVNIVCNCVSGYFWETSKCTDCSTAVTAANCALCSGYFFNTTESANKCLLCSSDPLATGNPDYSGATPGCECAAGYLWDSTNFKCDTCGTLATTKEQCGSGSCSGYALDGTKCTDCSAISNANLTATKLVKEPAACTCNFDYIWVAAADPAPASCASCSTAVKDDCGKVGGSCENWFHDGTSCLNVCTGTNVDGATQPTPIKGACLCVKGFAWDTTNNACVECKTLTTAETCAVSSCKGYFFLVDKCTTCGLLIDVDGSNVKALATDIAIDGVCQCKSGFLWNKVTFACEACATRPASDCAVGNCINFFVKGTGCVACPQGSTRNSQTKTTECKCAADNIWSTALSTCVACAAPKSLDVKTGACINCDTITNGNGALTPYDPIKCKCKGNYSFIGGACTCDSTAKLFDTGSGCATCNGIPGGLTYNAATAGCNCNSASTWSPDLKRCRCNDLASYMLSNGSCVKCNTFLAGTTVGGNYANPDQCQCADSLEWSTTQKKCVCTGAAVFNPTSGACESCAKAVFYSTGTVASFSACNCKVNMIWDSKTFSCICDSYSIVGSSKLSCINCKEVAGTPTTGTIKTSSTACACKTGWTWNANLKTCACTGLTANCTCPANSILNGTKICVPCSTISGSTVYSTSNTACKCAYSFVWNPTTLKCDCPATAMLNTAKTTCRNCDIRSSALSKGTSPNTCNCMTNYAWSATSFNCEIKATTDNRIMLVNGTKASCVGLGGSTGVSFDNFNCRCPAGSVWCDFRTSCIACSTIKNSTGSTFNPVSCVCNTDSYWDILSFSCKLKACNFGISDSRCTYCNVSHIQSKVSATLTLVTFAEKTIYLSGDAQFAAAAEAAAPVKYANYTGYKCLCVAGNTWSVARRRCYPNLYNATY